MPIGLKRYYGAGDLHFITCSCYRRRKVLGTSAARNLFLSILEAARQRYRFVILGYVVMPEHFHMLISEPQVGTPSTVMQVLKQRFACQLRGAVQADGGSYKTTLRHVFGSLASTTSTCALKASEWRSSAICIPIP